MTHRQLSCELEITALKQSLSIEEHITQHLSGKKCSNGDLWMLSAIPQLFGKYVFIHVSLKLNPMGYPQTFLLFIVFTEYQQAAI